MSEAVKPLRGPLKKRESNLWKRERNDWYIEPEWCSRRLFEEEPFIDEVCDPSCGSGRILKSCPDPDLRLLGMDIVKRGRKNLFKQDWLKYDGEKFLNIVSNPPFKLCDDRKKKTFPFVQKCLQKSVFKVALLLPANWIQGDMRSRWLETTPLRRVWFLSPRPSMPPGHIIKAGIAPGNGTTDYAWFVWEHGYEGRPEVRWLRKDKDK